VLPTVSRVAVLSNPENQSAVAWLKQLRAAAQVLGIKVQVLEVRTLGELEETFKAIVREQPPAPEGMPVHYSGRGFGAA
jgi:ABC-type uncharacterized transport system substrate-binding protein